jgi:hypothetical protein
MMYVAKWYGKIGNGYVGQYFLQYLFVMVRLSIAGVGVLKEGIVPLRGTEFLRSFYFFE